MLELTSDRQATQLFMEKLCLCLCACSFGELEGAADSMVHAGAGYSKLTTEQAMVQLLLRSLSSCCAHGVEQSMSQDLLLGVVNFVALGMPGATGTAGVCCCRGAIVGLASCIKMTMQSYSQGAPPCMFRALVSVQSMVSLLLEISIDSVGSIRGHGSFAEVCLSAMAGADAGADDAGAGSATSAEDMKRSLLAAAESFRIRKRVHNGHGDPDPNPNPLSIEGPPLSDTDDGDALFIAKLPLSTALDYTSFLFHEAILTSSSSSSNDKVGAAAQSLAILACLAAVYAEAGSVSTEDSLLALAMESPIVLQAESRPRKRGRSDDSDGDDDDDGSEAEEEEEHDASTGAGTAGPSDNVASISGSGIGRFSYVPLARPPQPVQRASGSKQQTASSFFGAAAPFPGTPALLQSLYSRLSPAAGEALERWDVSSLAGSLQRLSLGKLRRRVWNSARHMIFSLRNELLWATSALFRSLNEQALPVSVSTRLEHALYWCEELSAAIGEGLTVRTLRAFVELLEDIAFSKNDSSLLFGDVVPLQSAPAEKILALLKGIAFSIEASQPQLIGAVLHLLLAYGGRGRGLAACGQALQHVFAAAEGAAGSNNDGNRSCGDGHSEVNSGGAAPTMCLLVEKGALETVLLETLKVFESAAGWQVDSRSSSAPIAARNFFLLGSSSPYDYCDADSRGAVGSVCSALFSLFEKSKCSNSHGGREGDNNEDGSSQCRLQVVSERIRRKVLSLSLKYMRRCIAEVTKLANYCATLTRRHNKLRRLGLAVDALPAQEGDGATQETEASPESTESTADCHFLCSLLQRVNCETILSMREWIRRLPDSSAGSVAALAGRRKSYTYIAASPSDKIAHSLAFKIEELEWKLTNLLKDIDSLKQAHGGGLEAVLPIFFVKSIGIIDSSGRSTVAYLQGKALIIRGGSSNNNGGSSGSSGSSDNDDDDEIDEEDCAYGESDGRSDEEVGVKTRHLLSNGTSASIMRYASSAAGNGGRGGRRLKSRNRVINEWLGEERGNDDAYADLEDFIEQ